MKKILIVFLLVLLGCESPTSSPTSSPSDIDSLQYYDSIMSVHHWENTPVPEYILEWYELHGIPIDEVEIEDIE